jgi:Kef-type K+ transport system membrane component KefB
MQTETVITIVIGDVAAIAAAATLIGAAARRLGQPAVLGQIIAGVALGPTLLGRLPGDPSARLFPHEVQPFLNVLAQIAVVLFMFLAGYETDFRLLRRAGRAGVSVAVLALLTPMALTLAALWIFRGAFAAVEPHGVGTRSFTLFLAVATSITALPVLAALVRERNLAGTVVGTVALAAAALMDAAAWIVLAAALAGTAHSAHHSWPMTLGLLLLIALVLFAVVRPALGWWLNRSAALMTYQVPLALVLALSAAWATSSIGLHPVFGGFLAGLAMPRRRGVPEAEVMSAMEHTSDLLLPLFFVVTGLSFDIRSFSVDGLILLAVVLVVAVAGKMTAGYAGARLHRLTSRDSATVATLVNTRGLTELIALNVGLSAAVINREMFTVLVLMALLTTFAAGPLLSALAAGEPRTERRAAAGLRDAAETLEA